MVEQYLVYVMPGEEAAELVFPALNMEQALGRVSFPKLLGSAWANDGGY